MDDFKRIQHGTKQSIQLCLPRRPAKTAQPCLEAAALLELQHHVAGVIFAEIAVYSDNVGVIEARERLGFFDEPVEAPLVVFGTLA